MTRVTARQNKTRAKGDERDVARILGGRRHAADTGGLEDCEHDWLCIQVKGGLRVVNDVFREGLNAAQCATAGKAKLPCVVLVDRAGTRVKRYIAFDLEEFAAWYGLPGPEKGQDGINPLPKGFPGVLGTTRAHSVVS